MIAVETDITGKYRFKSQNTLTFQSRRSVSNKYKYKCEGSSEFFYQKRLSQHHSVQFVQFFMLFMFFY